MVIKFKQGLTPRQTKAVALLALGNLKQDVAKEVGIDPGTLSDWLQQPRFVGELNKLQLEILESARSKLHSATETAADTLIEIMKTEKNPEARRKAAMDILRLAGIEPGNHQRFGWGIDFCAIDKAERLEMIEG